MIHWEHEQELDAIAISAARVLSMFRGPSNRAIRVNMPEKVTQGWVDDVILSAHLAEPVWSEHVIVEHEPDIWTFYARLLIESSHRQFVLASDDCLVVGEGSAGQLLLAISRLPVGEKIFYQVSLHCLSLDDGIFPFVSVFRMISRAYQPRAYPDSRLIDQFRLKRNGKGVREYIDCVERQRPVFVFPMSATLPRKAREAHDRSLNSFNLLGPVVVNKTLFREYSSAFASVKPVCIAILPGGRCFPVAGDIVGSDFGFFRALEKCSRLTLREEDIPDSIGDHSLDAWWQGLSRGPEEEVERCSAVGELAWRSFLHDPEEQSASTPVEPDPTPEPAPITPERRRPIDLDDEGYPLQAEDIVAWSEERFSDSVVVLSRAARAMRKSRHPDPARIARAIEALAGPKAAVLRGDRSKVIAFNEALLQLRMRDGFSNGERLNGQTGDAYLVEYQGRSFILDRHLRSISSGFNDPKMIRIYYAYDRHADRILIGWLPTHLPNTLS